MERIHPVRPTFAQARWNCRSGYQGLQTEVVGKRKEGVRIPYREGAAGRPCPPQTGRATFHTSPVCRDLRGVQSESAVRVRNGR